MPVGVQVTNVREKPSLCAFSVSIRTEGSMISLPVTEYVKLSPEALYSEI